LAVGRFRPTPAGSTIPLIDEVALNFVESDVAGASTVQYRMWANLAYPEDPSFNAPVLSQELGALGWSIDVQTSGLLMGAATLDASGTDSLVFVTTGYDARSNAPALTSTVRVATLPANLPSEGWAPNVTFSTTLPIHISATAQLRLFDGDGDGAVDIFVLPQFAASREPLQILWNHQGTFDANPTQLKLPGVPDDGPYDFAPVQDAPNAPPALAFVSTKYGVAVAHLDPASHTVTSVTMVDAARKNATGIGAADVNGDGVQDLVVGDAFGNLAVYRGKPVLQ
jgi:hypothetical protein